MPKDWDINSDKVPLYIDGEGAYYVICYMQDYAEMEGRFKQYHPFGDNFVLGLTRGGCGYGMKFIRKEMVIA